VLVNWSTADTGPLLTDRVRASIKCIRRNDVAGACVKRVDRVDDVPTEGIDSTISARRLANQTHIERRRGWGGT
jgi:hypothetical protein